MNTKIIRFIDLCCGIGGFRLGLQQIGNKQVSFKCVFSADIKDEAIMVYNLNFKETLKKTDIFKVEVTNIPSFDLLCCGFPCQPFSSAGNKQGFRDRRGGMIFKIHEICTYHRPQTFMLENVSNLLLLESGRCVQQIVDMFSELGYHVSYKKINALDFGIPQSRERVFIVGSLRFKVPLSTLKVHNRSTIADILEYDAKYTDIPNTFADKLLSIHNIQSIHGFKIQDKRGGSRNIHSWDLDYYGHLSDTEKTLMNSIMLERRKKHWAYKKKIQWMDGMPLTESEISTFFPHDELPSMLKHLTDLGYLKLEKCKDIVKGKRQYVENSIEGYNICKGKLSFPVSQILDSNSVCPTLTATDSSKLVVILDNTYIRKLTDTELKRLCGYPDTFITPKNINMYDLFGNTVMPPIVSEIAKVLYFT